MQQRQHDKQTSLQSTRESGEGKSDCSYHGASAVFDLCQSRWDSPGTQWKGKRGKGKGERVRPVRISQRGISAIGGIQGRAGGTLG